MTVFPCMFFKAKYQSERTTEESFTDEINKLHCCEALLNTNSSKSYFFLQVLNYAAFFTYSESIPAIIFFFYWKFTTNGEWQSWLYDY